MTSKRCQLTLSSRRGLVGPVVLGLLALAGPASAANAGTAICKSLVERYRAVLKADPTASRAKGFGALSPLETLAKAEGRGVSLAEAVAGFNGNPRAEIEAWAAKEPQQFTLPEELLKKIGNLGQDDLEIEHLPGSDFYAASIVAGTGHCYSSSYFRARSKGQAELAGPPTAWSEAGCGVQRFFGTVDKTPAAFEDGFDGTPDLSADLMVTPWRDGGFGKACTIAFTFTPRFDANKTTNDWDEACSGPDCPALRQAALNLAEAVEKGPAAARKAAIDRLNAAQKREFATLAKLAGAADGAGTRQAYLANELADTAPLRLPVVHAGKVYLASVGHFTTGWRVFSDWSVKLQALEAGQLKDSAAFAIGMTKGDIAKVSIK